MLSISHYITHFLRKIDPIMREYHAYEGNLGNGVVL